MLLGFSTPIPRSVPLNPLRDALKLPAVVIRHRELLGAFVRRELRARIEGSLLGRVWPVVQPALTFLIFYAIFGLVLGIQYSEDLAPHPPAGPGWRATFYLITGILPWTALADSLGRGTGVVLENANLIKKIAFPSELLPLYQVVVFHVYFLIGFVILLGIELLVNGSLPGTLAWLPASLVVQMMFITGLTLLFSAANVFVRDVVQVVPNLPKPAMPLRANDVFIEVYAADGTWVVVDQPRPRTLAVFQRKVKWRSPPLERVRAAPRR